MEYVLIKSIHVFTMIAWVAGLFSMSSKLKYIAKEDKESQLRLAAFSLRAYRFSNLPSMIIVIFTGVFMIMSNSIVMKQGWMHTKLLIVVIFIIIDHYLMRRIKSIIKGKEFSLNSFDRLSHALLGIFLLMVIVLVVVKPF